MNLDLNNAITMVGQTATSLYASSTAKIVVLVIALLFCFAGYKLLRWVGALYGLVIGAVLGACVTDLLGLSTPEAVSLLVTVISMIVLGLVLAGICFRIRAAGIFLLCACIGAAVGYIPAMLLSQVSGAATVVVLAVFAVIFGIAGALFLRPVGILVTSCFGFVAAFPLMALLGMTQTWMTLLVGLVLTIAGYAVQRATNRMERDGLLHTGKAKKKKKTAVSAEDIPGAGDARSHEPAADDRTQDDFTRGVEMSDDSTQVMDTADMVDDSTQTLDVREILNQMEPDEIDEISSNVASRLNRTAPLVTPLFTEEERQAAGERTAELLRDERQEETTAAIRDEKPEADEPTAVFADEQPEPADEPTTVIREPEEQSAGEPLEQQAEFAWMNEQPLRAQDAGETAAPRDFWNEVTTPEAPLDRSAPETSGQTETPEETADRTPEKDVWEETRPIASETEARISQPAPESAGQTEETVQLRDPFAGIFSDVGMTRGTGQDADDTDADPFEEIFPGEARGQTSAEPAQANSAGEDGDTPEDETKPIEGTEPDGEDVQMEQALRTFDAISGSDERNVPPEDVFRVIDKLTESAEDEPEVDVKQLLHDLTELSEENETSDNGSASGTASSQRREEFLRIFDELSGEDKREEQTPELAETEAAAAETAPEDTQPETEDPETAEPTQPEPETTESEEQLSAVAETAPQDDVQHTIDTIDELLNVLKPHPEQDAAQPTEELISQPEEDAAQLAEEPTSKPEEDEVQPTEEPVSQPEEDEVQPTEEPVSQPEEDATRSTPLVKKVELEPVQPEAVSDAEVTQIISEVRGAVDTAAADATPPDDEPEREPERKLAEQFQHIFGELSGEPAPQDAEETQTVPLVKKVELESAQPETEEPETAEPEQPDVEPETESDEETTQIIGAVDTAAEDEAQPMDVPQEPEPQVRPKKAKRHPIHLLWPVLLLICTLLAAVEGIEYAALPLALCFVCYLHGRYGLTAFASAVLCVRGVLDTVALVNQSADILTIVMAGGSCIAFLAMTIAAIGASRAERDAAEPEDEDN